MPRKDFNYFECFLTMINHSCSAAALLKETLTEYDPEMLSRRMVEMHSIEHTADLQKHELLEHLARKDKSVLERKDILAMAQALDDVTDTIEEILISMYTYRITELRPQALQFTDLIGQCCTELQLMLEEMPNFRKSTTLRDHIVEINHLEEMGDQLYTESVRDLFTPGTEPLTVMAWSEVYKQLENCCDVCEDVADCVETVIMKNA